MKPNGILTALELPLLRRELIQAAQKRRTYLLRCLIAAIFSLLLLVMYSENISRYRGNILQAMGQGTELATALYVSNLIAIYAILPAISCSAITAEREKQTLLLLIVSRLTPLALVTEKFLSRLVPMIVLLLVTIPLLSVNYMMGGLRGTALLISMSAMLVAAIQVNSVAILCSALFRTSIESFFATYATLFAMAVAPPILVEIGLMPEYRFLSSGPPNQMGFVFDVFLICGGESFWGGTGFGTFLPAAAPPLFTSAVFFFVTVRVVANFHTEAPIETRRVSAAIRSFARSLVSCVLSPREVLRGRAISWSTEERTHRDPPIDNAISWREALSVPLLGWKPLLFFGACLFMVEFMCVVLVSGHRYDRQMFCILFNIITLIVSLLIIMGITCRTFASERERQTLDLLLTTPISNRELVQQKLSAASKARWTLMAFIAIPFLFRILGDELLHDHPNTGIRSTGPIEYELIALAHAGVFLTLVMWIAAWFTIRMNTLMKSLVSTLLTVLFLCIVPCLMLALMMILVGADPDVFPIWYFSSPAIIYIMNEALELNRTFDTIGAIPASVINLVLYSGMAYFIKMATIRQVPECLHRIDGTSVPRTSF